LPGEDGNVVMAAHRDTFFRSLRNIRNHDAVDVATTEGTRHYLVDSTQIVNSNDLAVLAPTAEPSLTLITCYPFEYFGHAPKRFIVRARLAEGR
jgi:sortase A